MLFTVITYQTLGARSPYLEWLDSLKDKTTRARIRARIDRLALGNFGDVRSLKSGIFELKFHFGPGYRVYFGRWMGTIIILLNGGDKSSQEGDIFQARAYWDEYLRRKNETLDVLL